ncbi:Uncharacterized membrane protein [Halogranum amylolyticum]|uniref:Uncharacterized membrane protein n=1 Tax=Halogranum amylolyticum TaxID=660520 RepID=A0A1H8N9N4_9EURY|nr:DUF63 family protein [Halogranum amylolyticum]SEO26315.1 Uncharacterized membrane protein [Halogranum amylolyticum]
MQILPEGFALPPIPYLFVILVAAVGVGVGVRARRPTVTAAHVVALAPWMAVGSVLHVLHVVGALPPLVDPLAGTPSVYVSVAIVVGAVWVGADAAVDGARVPTVLAASGVLALAPALGAAVLAGQARDSLAVTWPTVALVVAVALTAVVWVVLSRLRPEAAVTGSVGVLALFGHTLDGVSTAVGLELLGFGERTPLSRLIIELGQALPTAQYVGGTWLFVLVKLLVAGGVVVLMADYVREEPTEGYLLLGLVAAVGLGPGVHNLVLFSIA